MEGMAFGLRKHGGKYRLWFCLTVDYPDFDTFMEMVGMLSSYMGSHFE